jgi:hypothetical protein
VTGAGSGPPAEQKQAATGRTVVRSGGMSTRMVGSREGRIRAGGGRDRAGRGRGEHGEEVRGR